MSLCNIPSHEVAYELLNIPFWKQLLQFANIDISFCCFSFPFAKLGEIDGLLVPPGKASKLLTDYLITG